MNVNHLSLTDPPSILTKEFIDKELLKINKTKDKIIKITIPNNVIEIGADAFNGFVNISQVTIPPNVIEIGDRAFYGCTSLKEVIITSFKLVICYCTFENCTNLSEVTIKPSEEINPSIDVDYEAFYNCPRLRYIKIFFGKEIDTLEKKNNAIEKMCNNSFSITKIEKTSLLFKSESAFKGIFLFFNNLSTEEVITVENTKTKIQETIEDNDGNLLEKIPCKSSSSGRSDGRGRGRDCDGGDDGDGGDGIIDCIKEVSENEMWKTQHYTIIEKCINNCGFRIENGYRSLKTKPDTINLSTRPKWKPKTAPLTDQEEMISHFYESFPDGLMSEWTTKEKNDVLNLQKKILEAYPNAKFVPLKDADFEDDVVDDDFGGNDAVELVGFGGGARKKKYRKKKSSKKKKPTKTKSSKKKKPTKPKSSKKKKKTTKKSNKKLK